MCISWNNKRVFDTNDARCKHEEDDHYLKRLQTKENVPLLKFALRSVSAPQIHYN